MNFTTLNRPTLIAISRTIISKGIWHNTMGFTQD
nr:MAG TPA: hypothetical protein [Caudoviricetes sp.]